MYDDDMMYFIAVRPSLTLLFLSLEAIYHAFVMNNLIDVLINKYLINI